ncbi:uncharacterized protein [Ptychodera flava]|uniref:uncharacterized protein n=1 Tax=Ptychodera flava TaxID=63121 RepID=UPI00396A8A31
MKSLQLALTVLLSLGIPCAVSLTLEEEIPGNTLKITFKDVTVSQWSADGSSAIFRDEVANLTDTYCTLRATECSITQYNKSNPITINNVFITAGYPVEIQGDDLDVKFYVTLEGQPDITEYGPDHVIAFETLKEILTAGQSDMEKATGYTMMYVDTVLVLPPLDHTMNIIMIPIICLLLLIVIIVAISLQCNEQRREEDEHLIKRTLSRSKVSPSPNDAESGKVINNDQHDVKTTKANGEYSENHEKEKRKARTEKKFRHDESEESGEDNYGYATTPRGEAEKEYNIPQSRGAPNYDDNFDKHESKEYGKADERNRQYSESRDYRDDPRYDSNEDYDRRKHRSKKKKRHKHRGRRHREESSETDPDVNADVSFKQPPTRLPPLSEPNHATTEL